MKDNEWNVDEIMEEVENREMIANDEAVIGGYYIGGAIVFNDIVTNDDPWDYE